MAAGIIDAIGSTFVKIGFPLVAAYFTLEALLLSKAIASKRFSGLKGGPWLLIGVATMLLLIALPLMAKDAFLMAVCWGFLVAAFVVTFFTPLDDMTIEYDQAVAMMKSAGAVGTAGAVVEATGNKAAGRGMQYAGAAAGIYAALGLVSFKEGSWLVWVRVLALAALALMAIFLAVVNVLHLH